MGFALSLSGQWQGHQWQLIDNFQQWTEEGKFEEAIEVGWNAVSATEVDEFWLERDFYDPDNMTLGIYGGIWNQGNGISLTFAMKELPSGGILPGQTGTIFLRCLWPDLVQTWHIGTSDKPLEFDPVTGNQTSPGAFGDFNALVRLGVMQNIEHRDGDHYVDTDPAIQLMYNNQWYRFWMVVENTWDYSTTPPTSTGTHTLYVQGPEIGDGVSPVLIPVGTEPPRDYAWLRRAPADDDGNPRSIIWFMYETNAPPFGGGYSGVGGIPNFLDDLYFSPGINLTDPTNPYPWGVPPWVNEAKDVDTGDWMGWINVWHAPYLWLYATNNWLYMQEPAPDAPGAWGYFYK